MFSFTRRNEETFRTHSTGENKVKKVLEPHTIQPSLYFERQNFRKLPQNV